MGAPKIIKSFSIHENLPVEVVDVRDAIKEFAAQDEIRILKEDADPSVLHGVFYQYREPTGVYTEPRNVSLVVYNSNLPFEWQRVVCCKELLHVLDGPADKTTKTDQIDNLIEKLLGPLSTTEFSEVDLMAKRDEIALYQAFAILAPEEAMAQARPHVEDGRLSVSAVAQWAKLPENVTALVMRPTWPKIVEELLNC
jgi:hypothetical protein